MAALTGLSSGGVAVADACRSGSPSFAPAHEGFSKKLTNHAAAVSLYVSQYNPCRVREALRTTPAVALGIALSHRLIATLRSVSHNPY